MATSIIDISTLITTIPGIRGGRPHITGAGVTVRRIVTLRYKEQLSPEQIVEQMPHLSLAQVHAALAYYHANRQQMDSDIEAEEAEESRLEKEWERTKERS